MFTPYPSRLPAICRQDYLFVRREDRFYLFSFLTYTKRLKAAPVLHLVGE